MTNETLIRRARATAQAIMHGERMEDCTMTRPEDIAAFNAGRAATLLEFLADALERAGVSA